MKFAVFKSRRNPDRALKLLADFRPRRFGTPFAAAWRAARAAGRRAPGMAGRVRSLFARRSPACVFDIRTEDRRTVLEADGEDMLWVYAEVLAGRPDVAAGDLTRGIEFTAQGKHAGRLTLGRPRMKGSMKAVRVKALLPAGKAQLGDEEIAVVASVAIAGETHSAKLTLTLEEPARLKFTILE